jgi:hypothetical protein
MYLLHGDEPCTFGVEPHDDHDGQSLMPLRSFDRDLYRLWLRSHSHDDVGSTCGFMHCAAI